MMSRYVLKSSGASFHAHFYKTLNDIVFLSTKADPDVWYQSAVKTNSFEFCKCILCYVDDILCISRDPGIALGRIQAVFKFKGDKMEQLEIYLRYQVRRIIVDGEEYWHMSAEKYVRDDVENVEKNLAKSNQHLSNHCRNSIVYGCWT